jgi:hypothetical protein
LAGLFDLVRLPHRFLFLDLTPRLAGAGRRRRGLYRASEEVAEAAAVEEVV